MRPGTLIRPARPSEAADLSAMMRRTFAAANGHGSTPENLAAFLDAHYTAERQAQEIRDPDTLTLLVEQDGALAGYAQLRWGTRPPVDVAPGPAVELARIYLDAAFHGQGIAAPLVSHLLAAATLRGSRSVWLTVWQQAGQAIRFYRKHGFEIVGQSVCRIGDDAQDDWVMAQALPSR